jgi:tetratricopeptide (TPR) repeat protein
LNLIPGRSYRVTPDPYSPLLPDDPGLPPEENRVGTDLAFARRAQQLIRSGQEQAARELLETGVKAHPWYATGHLLLGRHYLAEARWEEARLELERALQLDGIYPATLEALAECYQRLGLSDLARGCRALGRDLDPRPLMSAEEEPRMTDEHERIPEPPSGRPEGPEDEEAAGAEDALAELEALLDGASSGLEGEEAAEEMTAAIPLETFEAAEEFPAEIPLETFEGAKEEPAETLTPAGRDTEGEEESSGGEDRSDLWRKILEQAEQVGEVAAEEEEAAAEPAPDRDDLWRKILEQADQLGSEEAPVSSLEEVLDADLSGGEGSGLEVEPVELEGVGSGRELEVAPLEGLEVSTPGGLSELVEPVVDGGGEDTGIELEESPVGDDVLGELEQTIERLEITQLFDEDHLPTAGSDHDWSVGGTGEPEPAPEEEVLSEETTGSPEEALKALEAELTGASEPEEEPVPEAAPGEEELGALEGLEGLEGLEALPAEEESSDLDELPPAPEPEPAALQAPSAVPGAPVRGGTFSGPEEAIRAAIKAEILAAQGKRDEAVRLFENLQLWDPEQAAFKQRLEELRRTE